jgi:hypothetical protein
MPACSLGYNNFIDKLLDLLPRLSETLFGSVWGCLHPFGRRCEVVAFFVCVWGRLRPFGCRRKALVAIPADDRWLFQLKTLWVQVFCMRPSWTISPQVHFGVYGGGPHEQVRRQVHHPRNTVLCAYWRVLHAALADNFAGISILASIVAALMDNFADEPASHATLVAY